MEKLLVPHLLLEFTNDLPGIDPHSLLQVINVVLEASGHFEGRDIKSRASAINHHRVGSASSSRGFVRVELAILSGRSQDARQVLAQQVLQTLITHVSHPIGRDVQVSVEVREMQKSDYAKATLGQEGVSP